MLMSHSMICAFFKQKTAYEIGTKGKYQLVVSGKSWSKLKQNLKAITRKTTPSSIAERITKLKEVGRGWLNYFLMASIHGKLKDLDGWVRNRLRYCIWHNWKKLERKRKKLIRLGIDHRHPYAWRKKRKGRWGIAESPKMGKKNNLEKPKKRGFQPMLDHYL